MNDQPRQQGSDLNAKGPARMGLLGRLVRWRVIAVQSRASTAASNTTTDQNDTEYRQANVNACQ